MTYRVAGETSGIAYSNITKWKQKKRERNDHIEASSSGKIKGLRKQTNPRMEDFEAKLFEWFNDQRRRRFPMSHAVLKWKALQMAEDMKIQDFCAILTWIYQFRESFGLEYELLDENMFMANEDVIKLWKKNLPKTLTFYRKSEIFTYDKTYISWKKIP